MKEHVTDKHHMEETPYNVTDNKVFKVDVSNMSTSKAIGKVKSIKQRYINNKRPTLFEMLLRAFHSWLNWERLTIPNLYTMPSLPARDRCIQIIGRVTKVAKQNNIELSLLSWLDVTSMAAPVGIELLGWHQDWIDSEHNVSGVRLCFAQDSGYWVSSWWDVQHSKYETTTGGGPAMYAIKPSIDR
jgi:hypothetical protein